MFKPTRIASTVFGSLAVAAPAFADVTAPTINTTGMDGIGTAILAAIAVVAGVGLMKRMLKG